MGLSASTRTCVDLTAQVVMECRSLTDRNIQAMIAANTRAEQAEQALSKCTSLPRSIPGPYDSE
jgi:hypothetical protein